MILRTVGMILLERAWHLALVFYSNARIELVSPHFRMAILLCRHRISTSHFDVANGQFVNDDKYAQNQDEYQQRGQHNTSPKPGQGLVWRWKLRDGTCGYICDYNVQGGNSLFGKMLSSQKGERAAHSSDWTVRRCSFSILYWQCLFTRFVRRPRCSEPIQAIFTFWAFNKSLKSCAVRKWSQS